MLQIEIKIFSGHDLNGEKYIYIPQYVYTFERHLMLGKALYTHTRAHTYNVLRKLLGNMDD